VGNTAHVLRESVLSEVQIVKQGADSRVPTAGTQVLKVCHYCLRSVRVLGEYRSEKRRGQCFQIPVA
jgi:hypothetical protein